jgi:hypothetical protein
LRKLLKTQSNLAPCCCSLCNWGSWTPPALLLLQEVISYGRVCIGRQNLGNDGTLRAGNALARRLEVRSSEVTYNWVLLLPAVDPRLTRVHGCRLCDQCRRVVVDSGFDSVAMLNSRSGRYFLPFRLAFIAFIPLITSGTAHGSAWLTYLATRTSMSRRFRSSRTTTRILPRFAH